MSMVPGRGAIVAGAALLLGSCSSPSILDPPGPRVGAFEPGPQADYMKLVAGNGIVQALRSNASYAPLEISGLRPAVAPQLGDWATCLRTWEAGKPIYFGVLMKDRAISNVRMAVAIDRCEQEQFLPLPTP